MTRYIYSVYPGININPFLTKYNTLCKNIKTTDIDLIAAYFSDKTNIEIFVFIPLTETIVSWLKNSGQDYNLIYPDRDLFGSGMWTNPKVWEQDMETCEQYSTENSIRLNKDDNATEVLENQRLDVTVDTKIITWKRIRFSGKLVNVIEDVSFEVDGKFSNKKM